MSELPIYGNLEEMPIEDSPIYGNLEDFTNIYSDEDFEAAAARIDLPPLPPKPQKRASWLQYKLIQISFRQKASLSMLYQLRINCHTLLPDEMSKSIMSSFYDILLKICS